MAVGRVGGGSKGRAGGVGGAGGSQGASKAGGSTFARVERSESLAGASGLVGPSGAAGAAPTDPVTAQALLVAKQLKSGQLKTREEATKKLVGDILKQKLRMQSQGLTQKIAEALQQDPRLQAALERIWDQATEGSDQSSGTGATPARSSGWTVEGE